MDYKDRYGNLFDGYDEEPKKQVYSHLLTRAENKVQKTDRYNGIFDEYLLNSQIASKLSRLKEKIECAVKENTDESRETAKDIRSNFFSLIKGDLQNKAFALYEKDDGTVVAFIFDDLIDCLSFVSNNSETLKTKSFRDLFEQYEDGFKTIDNYSVSDNILIIMLKNPSAGKTPAT